MKKTASWFVCVSVLCGIANGCGALSEATAMNQETTASYPEPPAKIEATPETSGLLVVDASIATFELDGVLLQKLDGGSEQIRMASFQQQDLNELALFSGLEPGSYKVAGFRGRNSGGSYFVRTSDAPMYNVTVEAGKPTYLGRFEARPNDVQVEIVQMSRPDRKTAVWSSIAEKYRDSSWATALQAKARMP